jgi:hypothetical protein
MDTEEDYMRKEDMFRDRDDCLFPPDDSVMVGDGRVITLTSGRVLHAGERRDTDDISISNIRFVSILDGISSN